MKFTLKNIKYSTMMSEETHCFQATLYIDGKKAFGVSNRGHGGCDDYSPVDESTYSQVRDRVEQINAVLAKEKVKLPDSDKTISNDLEFVVGDLVNQWIMEKEAKRLLKKIAYIKNGTVYTLPAKYKPTQTNLDNIQMTKWWKSEYVLLNGMSIEKVIEYMRGEREDEVVST